MSTVEPIQPSTARVPPPRGATRSTTRRQADFLMNEGHICQEYTNPPVTPQYIMLNTNNIFRNLVTLYENRFKAERSSFHSILKHPTLITAESKTRALATIYISHWFHDLYVTIREAAMKHPFIDYDTYFTRELVIHSREYDRFLTIVNAFLRPTHIHGEMEDSLYVPILSQIVRAGNNPFTLGNFTLNFTVFRAIIHKMKQSTTPWAVDTLSSDALGRPFWLFDWHETEEACAWFPQTGNYELTDVAIAYVVGVACTPTLAPRDYDVWVDTPYSRRNEPVSAFLRVEEQRFFGAFLTRSVEHESDMIVVTVPPEMTDEAKKVYETYAATVADEIANYPTTLETYLRAYTRRLATTVERLVSDPPPDLTEAQMVAHIQGAQAAQLSAINSLHEQQPPICPTPLPEFVAIKELDFEVHRHRVVDYIYYRRVISIMDDNTRTAAHQMIAFQPN